LAGALRFADEVFFLRAAMATEVPADCSAWWP
jgi:hypothetical protein